MPLVASIPVDLPILPIAPRGETRPGNSGQAARASDKAITRVVTSRQQVSGGLNSIPPLFRPAVNMQITPKPLVRRAQTELSVVRAGLASRGLSAIRQAASALPAATDWTRLPIDELVQLAYELYETQSHKADAIVAHLVSLDHADGYFLKAQLLMENDPARDWAHIEELILTAANKNHADAMATLGYWLTTYDYNIVPCPFDEESNEAEQWHEARTAARRAVQGQCRHNRSGLSHDL